MLNNIVRNILIKSYRLSYLHYFVAGLGIRPAAGNADITYDVDMLPDLIPSPARP